MVTSIVIYFVDLFDYSLIYQPNLLFLLFFLVLIIFGKILFHVIYTFVKILTEVRNASRKKEYFSISGKSLFVIFTVIIFAVIRFFMGLLRIMNKNLLLIERMGDRLAKAIKKEMFLPSIILLIFFIAPPVQAASRYRYPWPGLLPDHPLYKVKVLRNKIIERLIISPVRKVEFDLLMADKTLHASKLLLEKGNSRLALDTALKGENYFSMMTSDYIRAISKNGRIPESLVQQIHDAYKAHQELIAYMHEYAPIEDKDMYEKIDYFSDENYQMLQKSVQ